MFLGGLENTEEEPEDTDAKDIDAVGRNTPASCNKSVENLCPFYFSFYFDESIDSCLTTKF